MKSFFVFCVLLLAPYILAAQSFTVAVAPGSQVVPIGQTATYSVVITPLNGYKATVYLSVQSSPSFNGSVVLSSTSPNTPYENITLKITPTILDTGTKTFTIKAENGGVQSSATCTVSIPKNAQWSTVKPPWNISYGWGYNNYYFITKDTHDDICIATYNGNSILVAHFRNQRWEVDTIYKTNTMPYYGLGSFAYDKNADLWVAGYGVSQYDGKFFTEYNSSNSKIPGDSIHSMTIDKNGYPVCLVYDKNDHTARNNQEKDIAIARFDGTTWHSTTYQKPDIAWNTGNICIDSTNRIWIATYDKGMVRIADTTAENIQVDGTASIWSNRVSQVACDKDGDMWCMYWDPTKILSHFNGSTWTHIDKPADAGELNYLTNFLIDADKKVWYNSYGGLHVYNGTMWTTYNTSNSPLPSAPGNRVQIGNMIQDKNKNVWMVIGNVFYVFNPLGLVDIPLAPTAVDEQAVPTSEISISPNPSTHTITITGGSIAPVKILNSLGIEVAIGHESSAANDAQIIDISTLASGVYFAQCRTATGVVTKPFVVAR